MDAGAIAADTAMQLGIESSYEYHKTLVANDTLVYDVVGYNGLASRPEFAIIKRTTGNKTDTLVKEITMGVIVNAAINDLNTDGVKEVYIITRSINGGNFVGNVFAYKASDKLSPISFPDPSATDNTKGYLGFDSIYFQHSFIVRRYPLFATEDSMCATCATGGYKYVYYKLQQERISVAQTEIIP